jgi:Flp pilus assembly protein TadG
MFMLLFMFMELCLMFYTHDMISEVAREGTRYAMVRGASCPTTSSPTCEVTATQVNAFVNSIGWPNIGGGTMTVNTTYPDGNESVGSRVQVQVTYAFKVSMPFVPNKTINMSSTSVMYIIQ